ncbi:zf-HC2 domain-containing protein [Corynebacterium sp.]|uniref:zf-HC2 domain-containing protein n=1 Tax=Corynebacterium sp. TaxID=1720 RepID=UPI0026DEC918|nr:zf-HC2 domain-containing protein [Corynebacterium sp.]MDO5512267.1 zf-HC2 domain-containing protein [Corynebacterium sp.]
MMRPNMPRIPRPSAAKRRPRRREFASVEHLSPEAVAAFVDDELSDTACHRARVHLVHCAECRAEIERQRGASEWLRGSNIGEDVRAPHELLARLAGIASSPQRAGPDAESTPTPVPEGLMDKMEMILRAVRRNQGQ